MLRFFGILVLLAAIVFGGGLALGWWSVSSAQSADGTKSISAQMTDKGKQALDKTKAVVSNAASKVKKTIGGAFNKVKNKITGKGKAAKMAEKKLGTLASIDGEKRIISLKIAGTEIPFPFPVGDAIITLNGKAVTLAELQVGDKVELLLDDAKPTLTATR